MLVVARNVRKRGRMKMTETELERVSREIRFEKSQSKNKTTEGIEVSLTVIAKALTSIAEELAIMNDRAAEGRE